MSWERTVNVLRRTQHVWAENRTFLRSSHSRIKIGDGSPGIWAYKRTSPVFILLSPIFTWPLCPPPCPLSCVWGPQRSLARLSVGGVMSLVGPEELGCNPMGQIWKCTFIIYRNQDFFSWLFWLSELDLKVMWWGKTNCLPFNHILDFSLSSHWGLGTIIHI